AEQITRRLESGDSVDVEEYARRYPSWAGSIRGFFPTLRQLVALGQSASRGRNSLRSPEDRDPRSSPPGL
ncbi:hypothetical protein ACYOEI_21255, partial [Singulisphaera rosea]